MIGNEYNERLKKTLALNRNRLINPLVSEIPIHALIDSDFCAAVSGMMNGNEQKWQRRLANPDVGGLLPDRHGVYMFCWEPLLFFETEETRKKFDWCLYVGKADRTTIRSRFDSEYKNYLNGDPELLYSPTDKASREGRLSKYLCLQPLSIWFLVIDDRAKISDLEDKLIDLLNPPLNKQKSLRARFLEPESAF